MESGDSDLKQQFQQLQQLQQQRLLDRRKKKEDAKRMNKEAQNNDVPEKFGVNDDLGLKLAEASENGCRYASEELLDHLNDQIRKMKDENGRLYKLVNEKDFEIRKLKKKGEESKTSSVIDGQVTNETAATKIIELSKKVRELTAEKETEKSKCRQFQKKFNDIHTQLLTLPHPSSASSVTGSMLSTQSQSQHREDNGVDVKALQERLKQSESRLTDFRNQCQQLRQELKVAHKVLSQEIGENVNIQSLLNETSNWRGRAQHVIGLQQKVDELKMQLEGVTGEVGGLTVRRMQDERYREELRRMEKERKEAQENAVTKLKTLEAEHENFSKKMDAAKARNQVLSSEIKATKTQVQTLLKKSRNDDEFIEALLKQQSQLKTLLEKHNIQQVEQHVQQQHQLQQMSMKSQQDSNIVEQLKAISAQKEAQVKMLEMELQHLRMMHSQADNHNSSDQTFQSIVSTPQPVLSATADSRPSTTTDTITTSQRDLTQSALGSARSISSRLSNSNRGVSASAAQHSLPSTYRIGDEEISELKYQLQEHEVMTRAVEVERDKMTELVQVLQTRLSNETEKLSENQAELQGQKRLAVELEKRLGRYNLESGKRKGSTVKGGPPAKEDTDEDADSETNVQISELIVRLDIQKDENQSLKVSLQRALQAKEEDLKVYAATLEETKKVFLQALKQMKDKQTKS